MNTFCDKCGKKLEQNDEFCQSCGAKIGQAETITDKRKIIDFVKKYLSEILFLAGVWIASYYLLLPPSNRYRLLPKLGDITEYYTGEKAFGIVLIAFALVVGYRRYLENKK